MIAPLIKGREVIGFLGVDNPRFNQETEMILMSVSSFVVTELEKRQFIEDLYNLSYKDMMTGVYNRYANTRALEEFSEKHPKNIGIIYCDVNGLKETNDKFDHEHGDKLIIDAANILKKHYTRNEDSIYRVGGDEFIVICNGIAEDSFNKEYDELVEELGPNYILSTGKSWLPLCENIKEHIKNAERAMYLCKEKYYKVHDRRRPLD